MSTELDARRVRAATNQSLFREVNERIAPLKASYDQLPGFICECLQEDCTEEVKVTLAEYERLRLTATHFAVLPGHVVSDVERVVEENDRFLVVEKMGEAAKRAIQLDPRSRRERLQST